MQCPKCQFINPEEMKFCGECGTKLEKFCPKCNFSNPPQFKFCGNCGRDLAFDSVSAPMELSFDEKIAKIQKYLPRGLTDKILSQRNKIEGENKHVSVMFCDMVGFTPLVEKLGPEEAYLIMDQVYELLIHKVNDYDGTVNEMTGDGVMALFGAPIALEDAPQRAIRSAMAIHREMTRFNDKIKRERPGLPPLRMRAGVNTGSVVVGTLGNDLRVEFKAVGDTVNLASRMESMAEPGATFITEDTFKLTEGFFRFESLGKKDVKGKKEPIEVYKVIAPSTRRTRFDVNAERGLTPFIGRDRELDLLLYAFERAKGGRGQAVSIISEAGVGKSRLIYEFRKAIANEDTNFLEGKCISYKKVTAYHPFQDVLKANFNIQDYDNNNEIREKVKHGLKILGADEIDILSYILQLLSVEGNGLAQLSLSPEGNRIQVIETLKRIVLKGSDIKPLVLVFEDLQWMDKASEEVLKYALDAIPGSRVLLLFTYRPEYAHEWSAKSYHSQIVLNRLSNRDSIAMVSHLLGDDELDKKLEKLVLDKTEGVPFFIEEFIRSLLDLGIIERSNSTYICKNNLQDIKVPSTIQEIIMARVDSLPGSAKEILQMGAVIEREFSFQLIKEVTKINDEELLSHISHSKDAELIYERGVYPHNTYIFTHALTQEVIYNSIMKNRRKRLHGIIAIAIESVYAQRIKDFYELLAHHYSENANYEKAYMFYNLASGKAEKAGAIYDAIALRQEGIACIEKLTITDENHEKLISARTTLGMYFLQMFYYSEAKSAVEPIYDLTLKSKNQKAKAHIFIILGAYFFYIDSDVDQALSKLGRALEMAEDENDIVSLFFASQYLGIVQSYNCHFELAIEYFKKALAINIQRNTKWGISVSKSALAHWGFCYQGKIDLAYQTSREAIQLAEDSGDIYSKAAAYLSYGCANYYKGYFNKSIENINRGIDFCDRIDLSFWVLEGYLYLTMIYFELGKFQEVEQYCRNALKLSSMSNIQTSSLNLIKLFLYSVRLMNNDSGISLDSENELIKKNNLRFQSGLIKRIIGKTLVFANGMNLSEAEKWIEQAIDSDKQNGTSWSLGLDYKVFAEYFKFKGEFSKAKGYYEKAINILNKCAADGWVSMFKKDFASLS